MCSVRREFYPAPGLHARDAEHVVDVKDRVGAFGADECSVHFLSRAQPSLRVVLGQIGEHEVDVSDSV